MEFGGRFCAGPKIADVAGVFPVGNHRETFRTGERFQFSEEFVFAKIAAICRIREIGGILEFLRLHNANGKVKSFAHFQSFLQFLAGKTRGIGNGSQRPRPENLVRNVGQKNRVNSARICDNARPVRTQ